MNENVVLLIANIIVVLAWGGTSAFILAYAVRSPWSSTLVGRTLMHRAASMWLLLTYALTSRWIEPIPEVQQALGLGVYALIALMEWRLFLVLRFVQEGNVTPDHPDYQPLREWWRRVTKKERV